MYFLLIIRTYCTTRTLNVQLFTILKKLLFNNCLNSNFYLLRILKRLQRNICGRTTDLALSSHKHVHISSPVWLYTITYVLLSYVHCMDQYDLLI